MKGIALAAGLGAATLLLGCGDDNPGLFPDDFEGTFTISFSPTRIECAPATAQVQITGLSLTGSGSSGARIAFDISGSLSGLTTDRSVSLVARADSNNAIRFGMQMTGTAFKREGGVSLTGNYLDSNECEGNWASAL